MGGRDDGRVLPASKICFRLRGRRVTAQVGPRDRRKSHEHIVPVSPELLKAGRRAHPLGSGGDKDQEDRTAHVEPAGAGPDDGVNAAGDEGYPPDADSDPITEVIDIPAASLSDTAERRHTAPGFDAGSTQIINRLPDESAPRRSSPPRHGRAVPLRRPLRPASLSGRVG